jgi:uncharacterized protein (UPF0332 family)
MNDNDNKRQREIEAYMRQAQSTLTAAHDTLQTAHYRTSVGRSYYAVFYATTALLLSIGESRSSHYGLLSGFRQSFIKDGRWPVECSDLYGNLIEARETSDYSIYVPISQADATDSLQEARLFVAQAEKWLRDEEYLR